MNPFERLPIEKQARIVNASISEFAEKDYETASMNVVVNHAGISKGSLFNYFKTKSTLYDYVYALALGEVKAYLKDVRDSTIGLPFNERLTQIIDSGVQFIVDHPRLAKIYFRLVYSSDSPNRKKIITELQLLSNNYLGEIIQDGINHKELNSTLNKAQAVFYLDAVLNRFLKEYHDSLSNGKLLDRNDWVNSITELFTKGFK
ncbi:MAG: TetR/AcrR family transcriptional regulator [Candidatus Marinimicrobia bacterium]|nr:TetR/AcrR family transcriptional regulator [Candidatus Neomarinimicrobiota bacterium]